MQLINHSYFIDVILPLPLERNFSYAVTEAEFEFIKPGMRVAVPFGKRKIYTALVFKLHNTAPTAYDVKSIHSIIDETPIIHEVQLRHWSWIAQYYMCAIGDVLSAALPNALLLQSESIIALHPEVSFDENTLTDDQFIVIEALQQEPRLTVDEVHSILHNKNTFKVLKPLLDAHLITTSQELVQKYKPKLLRCVTLHTNYSKQHNLEALLEQLQRSKKQKQIVLAYFSLSKDSEKVAVAEIKKTSGGSSAQIKTLIDKGVFEEHFIEIDRLKFDELAHKKTVILSAAQNDALSNIKTVLLDKDVCLFHGVTSSGKTEIYVKLIEEALENHQQALFLVPEIALTSQLVLRLKHFFGDQIEVYERTEVARTID